MKRSRIVVVGSANTDMVFRSNRLPEAGETLLGARFSMVAGGKGANQAVAAARLGGDVAFVARVGRDSLGEAAIDGFRRDSIDTAHIAVSDDAASGVAAILVDETTGQNRIIVASGANAQLSVEDVRAAGKAIAAADMLVCQLEVPLEAVSEALAIAQRSGVPAILNPAPARKLPLGLIAMVSYLIPNEIEANQLAFGEQATDRISPPDAAAKLRATGAGTVIVTLGADGAYALSAGGELRVSGRRVAQVVDTTAAGDCFTGALAVALAEGRGLAPAISFANRAAAISVTRPGAQPSIPTRAEVDAQDVAAG